MESNKIILDSNTKLDIVPFIKNDKRVFRVIFGDNTNNGLSVILTGIEIHSLLIALKDVIGISEYDIENHTGLTTSDTIVIDKMGDSAVIRINSSVTVKSRKSLITIVLKKENTEYELSYDIPKTIQFLNVLSNVTGVGHIYI